MKGLLAAAADLPALMSGGFSVIASAALPGLRDLAVDGLALWAATPEGTGLRLSPAGGPPSGPVAPLAVPPGGTLLLVARDEEEFAGLRAWWRSRAGRDIPLVVAESAAAALRPVLEHLAQELRAANARAVGLERQLTETRIDYEETRVAMATASRLLGHRPPAQPALEVATEPSGERVGVADGPLRLRQRLGRKLDGLAALALHLDEVAAEGGEILRIRLLGEESGRILGAWNVPLAEAQPGWLALDLPTPLGVERETALLEIAADGPAPDAAAPGALSLSLERGWVPAELACLTEGPDGAGRALALRLWTAEPGARFVVPAHWDWDAAGGALPLAGVPQHLSRTEWDLARVLTGEFSSATIGSGAARVVARLSGGKGAALLLPAVSLGGTDVLRLRCEVRSGDPAGTRFAVWLTDREAALDGLGDLAALGRRARFSGWYGFPDGNRAELTMTIPVAVGRHAQLVLEFDGPETGGVRLEITELSFLATRNRTDVLRKQVEAGRPAGRTAPQPPPRPPVPLPQETVAVFDRVELHQHLVGARGYQHLDLTVHALAGEGHHWPGLRFKLSLKGEEAALEWRRLTGWPVAFAQWPGTEADRFGPFVRVRLQDAPRLAESLSDPRDAAMLTSLLQVLGTVAGRGARLAGLDEAAEARWLAAAGQAGAPG